MTIKLLNVDDSKLYFEHLVRVFNTKGLHTIPDREEIEKMTSNLSQEKINKLFLNNNQKVWGKFNNGIITNSVRTRMFDYENTVFIANYKSENIEIFNPIKHILPLLEEAFSYYENIGYYNFIIIRPTKLFSLRKYKSIEDISPLNRYNSYYDEIIPPNKFSEFSMYRELLWNRIYPIELGVVSMSLKQEYRKYGDKKNITYTRTDDKPILIHT
jgi:hypothetical protein